MRIIFIEKGMNAKPQNMYSFRTNYYINYREGIVVRPFKTENMTQHFIVSRVAQWKRAGPITQRSEDQNLALLWKFYFLLYIVKKW